MPTPSHMYPKGSLISGTTTPSVLPPPTIYARAFTPAEGVSWPSKHTKAVLLANSHDKNAQNGELWRAGGRGGVERGARHVGVWSGAICEGRGSGGRDA